MIVKVSTELETTPDRAWLAVKRPETLQYVTRGVLGFRPLGELPQVLGEGTAVRVRLFFFHVLPAWSHEIHVVRVAEAEREIFTNERGGPVRSWNHRIEITPLAGDAGRRRY